DSWEIYRSATHIHSNISDGSVDFADMVEGYYAQGYDAIAMTDHGTVNYGWSVSKSRHAIFAYQLATHGEARGVSNARHAAMLQGEGRDGQKMVDIPLGNELNGACLKKVHINSYFADVGDGYMGMAETWPTSAVEKSHNAGGLTHLNHIGEWSGADEDVTVYDNEFIYDLAEIFLDYSSCVGMELVNKADGRTQNDRYLYDQLLMRLAPQGRNIFGFCEDDAHELDQIGKGVQFFVAPSSSASNIRTAMTNGTFFASAKASRDEMSGFSFEWDADFPYVTRVDVDETSDQISFEIDEAHTGFIVADGNVLDSLDCSDGTVTFDLNKYESSINRYVRIYFIGPGGVTYVQPFLLSSSAYKTSTTQFTTNIKNANIVVKDADGNVVLPVNNDYTYILNAGDYTYTASCTGYKDITDSFTVTAENISAGTQKKIALPFADNLSGKNITFYVPETIYLAVNSTTNFQYYLDRANISNGLLTADAHDTEGNIYFACGDATSVTIRLDSVTTAKGTNSANYVSGATTSGQSYTGTITSGTLSSGLSAGSGVLIRWTASYTVSDGSTKEAYAYSYVYRPSTNNVSAGMEQIHTYSSDVENVGLLWATGFNSVSGGAFRCNLDFLTTDPPSYNVNGSLFASCFSIVSGGGANYYQTEHSSNAADEHILGGGTGTVYVDSSRITNLSQVPTLRVGFWQFSIDGDDAVAVDFTRTDGNAEAVLYQNSYYGVGEVYSDKIDYEIESNSTGTTSLTFHAYTDTSRGKRHNYNSYYVYVSVIAVDKDELRDTYNSAISKAYVAEDYASEDYNKYLKALEQAALVLGNPTSTQSSINTAKNALVTAMSALRREGDPFIDNTQKFIYGLKENLDSFDEVFASADGYFVSYEGSQIGTGTDVTLTIGGTSTDYKVIIFGDVDGSGVVDGDDSFIVTMIINGFFTKDTLGNAKWFAADVNFDG
ncbi:MAG: hypothetical protein IJM97_00255, partial [Clostridia bacterium]|nr:hypothetical protein [Clostridia bacterium]